MAHAVKKSESNESSLDNFKMPEEYSHYEVQLDGLKVHYVREGAGEPLILWHGWPGFWWDWRYVIEPLSKHFDVIIPDFRGAGDTEKTDLSDISKYSADQLADDQAAFMDALGISKAYLLAHDYGSMTAHKFIRRYPNKIIKAAILDPVTPSYAVTQGTYTQEDWFALFDQLDVAIDLIGLNRESRKIYYSYIFNSWSNKKPLLSEIELDVIIDNYMKPGNVHGGINYDRANLAPDSNLWNEKDFEKSDVPVTLLWAMDDPAVPPTARFAIPDFYSNYTLELIEDCGHFVMVEKPDFVIDRVLKGFNKI